MDSIERLTEFFRQFPGIGPRQARRFVYFLLTRDREYVKGLMESVEKVRQSVSICTSCFRFFTKEKASIHAGVLSNSSICQICGDTSRDTSLRMIVAKDADLEAVEKSHSYHGLYFVLGGNIPILEKNPEQKVRLRELNKLMESVGSEADKDNEPKKLKEIILSFSTNSEGEHTTLTIKQILAPFAEAKGFKVSILGRGLSTGAELEYSDGNTISEALKNRS
ncbi:MAG: toprim domain-containing protein [bacterium]